MEKLRILICDGNTEADRASFKKFVGCAPSKQFESLLKNYNSQIRTEIAFPADPGPLMTLPLGAYDGILITGSNSHIYEAQPGNLRQIEFAQKAFASGTPMFGVCWGMQLAVVAAGGEVLPSRVADCSCETPFATGVELTSYGSGHPMHHSRTSGFDVFSFHSDEVTRLPGGAVVTARNRNFIQAVEIKHGRSTFWGVQYHPELSGWDQAGFLRESARSLVEDGSYETLNHVEHAAQAISMFKAGAQISEENLVHFEGVDTNSFEFRPLEILNWLDHLVIPTAKRKFGWGGGWLQK
uniref:Gamma-glutamyl-L-1-hydroxyisopropylamide hydrolase n=1 Tax=Pseudomonas sp. TaxID=306 RepID=IPUF_PSESP|nr:RecName: Full=Gamma-glutamyl-L-1-hydroxyisopropylamide hydrolase; AltName: Full=Gamma-glutamyl-L-alaninol hydrolase; Short=Galo hydrolase [Pseudomonas sp.]CAC81338.1 gamma-glutamyl-L-1-hydroxyisopropylamide hydrolase [Pseudomonas sp. KIE171]